MNVDVFHFMEGNVIINNVFLNTIFQILLIDPNFNISVRKYKSLLEFVEICHGLFLISS